MFYVLLTLNVSHVEATSRSTVTFEPPPLAALTYLFNTTERICTCVPSCKHNPYRIKTSQASVYQEHMVNNQESKINPPTSISPFGIPSKSDGLIHPSTTSHPPKLTALTLGSPSAGVKNEDAQQVLRVMFYNDLCRYLKLFTEEQCRTKYWQLGIPYPICIFSVKIY